MIPPPFFKNVVAFSPHVFGTDSRWFQCMNLTIDDILTDAFKKQALIQEDGNELVLYSFERIQDSVNVVRH